MKNNIQADESTRSSERVAYPFYGFNRVLEVSQIICDLGGSKTTVPKSLIASHLKMEESSPTLTQIISAAKCFGFIEGRSLYVLTELGKQYYFPTSEGQKQQALLQAFSTPPAFNKLIERFDGNRMPSSEMIANLLHRDMNVPESWKGRVTAMFMSSGREAGAIDSDGFLRFHAKTHVLQTSAEQATPNDVTFTTKQEFEEKQIEKNDPEKTIISQVNAQVSAVKPGSNVWLFNSKGATVRLETSSEIPMELWEKLNLYVQVIKPAL